MDKGEEWGPTWAGLVGPMASWAAVQQGGGASPPFFCILFLFLFFNLFSLNVLFQFRAFKYLINLCFLYYNYLCDIRHNLNIFVSMFEN